MMSSFYCLLVQITWFCPVKQVWVICTFSQLHENVEKSHFVSLASSIYNIDVLHQNLGVPAIRTCNSSDTQFNIMYSTKTNKTLSWFSTFLFFFYKGLIAGPIHMYISHSKDLTTLVAFYWDQCISWFLASEEEISRHRFWFVSTGKVAKPKSYENIAA